jgi:hypothetical protein
MLHVLPKLLHALLNISLAHNWLKTSLLVIKLQPSLVQALPANASPLAQLPGINPEKATELEIVNGTEGKRWLEKFVKKYQGTAEYAEAVEVAKWWPKLEITDAEFKGVLLYVLLALDEANMSSYGRKGRYARIDRSTGFQSEICVFNIIEEWSFRYTRQSYFTQWKYPS